MTKIAIITGSRAEYGLFYPLLKKIDSDNEFSLQLIVTGMHLSPEFGLTYKVIERDGFDILDKVEMLLSSDTETAISKAIGLGLIGFADSFRKLNPDLLLVLGDRFETYAATIAGYIGKIPIGHFHGGELTEGVIDEGIRHSITKMSTYHFATTDTYKRRIIQMGEQPNNVFNVGALGLDNIKSMTILSKKELQKNIDFEIIKPTCILTYHPVTLEKRVLDDGIDNLLEILDKRKNLRVIFTMPNADTNGRSIMKKIKLFVNKNPKRSIFFNSLGQKRYLSSLKYVDFVIGNSSSGIIEAPSFEIPTINIGDRQKGRIRANTVIDCDSTKESIDSAIDKALSKDFITRCKFVNNPYGDGNTVSKVVEILRNISLEKGDLIKKSFYDLDIDIKGHL